MAYFLRSGEGSAEFVSIPQMTTATNVWSFYIDFKISRINYGVDSFLISTTDGSTTRFIYRDGTSGDHSLTLRSGSNHDFDINGLDFTVRTKLRIVSDGTDLSLYINDVMHETLPGEAHVISLMFDKLLEGASSTTVDVDLYEAYFDSGFTQERRYNPSSSSGTGSLLTDTISAENGTLTGFPTDDSQWISYVASAAVTTTDTLQPGEEFTLTATNFASAPVSPVTLTDSQGSTITVPVTISGSGPYTAVGTMPTLAEAVTAGTSLLFGDVTIELTT